MTPAQRVARRFIARLKGATDFPSQEALKDYLHEHPGADPANHSVKKPDEGGEKKEEGGKGKSEKDDEKKPEKKLYDQAGDAKDAVGALDKAIRGDLQKLSNPFRSDGKTKTDEDKKTEAHDTFKKTAPKLRESFDKIEKIFKDIPEAKRNSDFAKTFEKEMNWAKSLVEETEKFAKDPAEAAKGAKQTWGRQDSAENIHQHAKNDLQYAQMKLNNLVTSLRSMTDEDRPAPKPAPAPPKKKEEPKKEEPKEDEGEGKKPWYKVWAD